MSIVCAILLATNAFAQPSDAPTTPPARNAADVISLYSESYAVGFTNINFNPNWGQNTVVTTETIAGNEVRKLSNLNYQGHQFDDKDVSSMAFLHIDLWSDNSTAIDLFVIANGVGEKARRLNIGNGWNSYEIPLSHFSSAPGKAITLNNIFQFKFVGVTPGEGSTVYYDNLYFYRNSTPATLTDFTVPEKSEGSASFAITAPTSNSAGAFTYASSNEAVATVTGNMINVIGKGTAFIIANQAANGSFGPGYIQTQFLVTSAPPTDAPTTPPARPAQNVVSLYGEEYANIPTYIPNFGASTVITEETYAGNKVQRMINLNYQLIGEDPRADASNMQFLHIDIWTPDLSEFQFSITANDAETGSANSEAVIDITPTLGGWNSFDIPLTEFTLANPSLNFKYIYFVKFATGTPNTTVYYDNMYFYTNAVLPVTLTSFDVKAENNGASLKWQTASEANNKGFSVERSLNGQDWTSLAFVAGNNNSTSVKNYAYTDKNPANGVNYYRLVQEDNDGKKTISDVKSTNFEISTSKKLVSYPNPATDKLFVQLGIINNSSAVVSLVDLQGKIKRSVNVNQSNSNTTLTLAVQGLPEGLYFLTIKDGADLQSSKVIIK